jgi:hypothetical protein
MKDNVMLHHRVSALDTLPDVTRNGRHRPRMEALLAELCLPEICQGPIRDCARAPCLCCAAALHGKCSHSPRAEGTTEKSAVTAFVVSITSPSLTGNQQSSHRRVNEEWRGYTSHVVVRQDAAHFTEERRPALLSVAVCNETCSPRVLAREFRPPASPSRHRSTHCCAISSILIKVGRSFSSRWIPHMDVQHSGTRVVRVHCRLHLLVPTDGDVGVPGQPLRTKRR